MNNSKANNSITHSNSDDVPVEYQNLLKDVSLNVSGKVRDTHAEPPSGEFIWEGKVFRDYFGSMPDGMLKRFKEYFDEVNLKYETFRDMHKKGLSEASAKKIIILSKIAQNTNWTSLLKGLIEYCERINFEPRWNYGNEDVIQLLKNGSQKNNLENTENRPSGLFFNEEVSDHINIQEESLAKAEIERIRKYLGFYPYNKTRLTNPSKEKLSRALDDVDRLLETLPKNIDLLALKAAFLNGLGFLDDALSISQGLYDANSSHEAVVMVHVNCLYKSGRVDEALSICSGYVQQKPNSFLAHINLAKIYQSKELIYEAIECYRRAISLDEEFLSAYLQLGNCYGRIHLLDKQEAVLRKALVIAHDSFQVKSQLIANLVIHNKHSEAKELMLDVSRSGSDIVNKAMLEAIDDFESGLFVEARDKVRSWVNHIIDDPLVSRGAVALNLCNLGLMIDEKEMCREAREFQRECFLEALIICPDQELANAGLIGLEINSGEFHIARQEFFKVRDALQNQKRLRDFCDFVSFNIVNSEHRMLPFEWYLEEHSGDINAHIHVAYFFISHRNEEKSRECLECLRKVFQSISSEVDNNSEYRVYGFECARVFFEFEYFFNPEKSYMSFALSVCEEFITDDLLALDHDLYTKFTGLHFDALCFHVRRNKTKSGLIDAIGSGERYLEFIPKVRLFEEWSYVSSSLSDLYLWLFEISGEAQHKDKSKVILSDIDKMAAFYGEGRD